MRRQQLLRAPRAVLADSASETALEGVHQRLHQAHGVWDGFVQPGLVCAAQRADPQQPLTKECSWWAGGSRQMLEAA